MPRTSWKQQHPDEWNAMQRAWRVRNGSSAEWTRREFTGEEDRMIRESTEPVTVLARLATSCAPRGGESDCDSGLSPAYAN